MKSERGLWSHLRGRSPSWTRCLLQEIWAFRRGMRLCSFEQSKTYLVTDVHLCFQERNLSLILEDLLAQLPSKKVGQNMHLCLDTLKKFYILPCGKSRPGWSLYRRAPPYLGQGCQTRYSQGTVCWRRLRGQYFHQAMTYANSSQTHEKSAIPSASSTFWIGLPSDCYPWIKQISLFSMVSILLKMWQMKSTTGWRTKLWIFSFS